MKDRRTERDAHRLRLRTPGATPPRAVIGLEAEFNLFVNGRRRRPEKVFGDPSRLVRRRMIPRTGKSFQLPAGGAIYFDTGVIEVATPIVELEPGCCYRATRSLWEQIRYLRRELDHWARRHKCQCTLQGFSTHYNFSFRTARKSKLRNATKLAYLLAHILPVPVILLATNRQSSAVGVRPRGNRIEVTVDFTPGPRVDAGNVCVHRRRHGNRAPLGRFSPKKTGTARTTSNSAIPSAKTFVATRMARHR